MEAGAGTAASLITQSMFWPTLLEPQPLEADAILKFTDLKELGAITHIRSNMIRTAG